MPWTEISHRGTAYIQIATDPARRLLRMRRRDLGITLAAADSVLIQFAEDMDRLLPKAERRSYRLLVDTREAPRIADPELEGKLLQIMSPLMMSFACAAVVLRTAIGVLQMRRLMRTWPIRVEVFHDESEAILWLLRQDAAGSDSGPQ